MAGAMHPRTRKGWSGRNRAPVARNSLLVGLKPDKWRRVRERARSSQHGLPDICNRTHPACVRAGEAHRYSGGEQFLDDSAGLEAPSKGRGFFDISIPVDKVPPHIAGTTVRYAPVKKRYRLCLGQLRFQVEQAT